MCRDAFNEGSRPQLPPPDIYEAEYKFWPWGRLLAEAAACAISTAPRDGHVVDYMCGTGYLLNLIQSKRPDLSLEGWDILQSYIEYGRRRYPNVVLHCGDA